MTVFFSCNKEAEKKTGPTAAALEFAAHFPSPVPSPERNPLTLEGIALGRMLFFDPLLSGNDSISCATCHLSSASFADPGQQLSQVQAHGGFTKRHSPALINLSWMQRFFWDGGVKNLESIPVAALRDSTEMLQDLTTLEAELSSQKEYPDMFEAAFGRDTITLAMVFRALAQFQRTMISDAAPYDDFRKDSIGHPLSALEAEGLRVVRTKCAPCHQEPLFTDNRYHNNGLDTVFSDVNIALAHGHGRISEDSADIGKFKTPTLRNVLLTPPYMHDGRFATIDEVLDHYSHGMGASWSVEPSLVKDDGSLGIDLSDKEKNAIKEFLLMLTDDGYAERVLNGKNYKAID